MTTNTLIQSTTLDQIYDFIDNGTPDNCPENIAVYLDLMDKVRSMHNRVLHFGTKESILKHLIKAEKLSRHIATKLYYDALEYFHVSHRLSKEAQRNIYADKADRLIAIAEGMVKSVKDTREVTAMLKDAYMMRGLDKPDIEKIPEDYFKEQWILYTTDALEAGIEKINRLQLAQSIDKYPEVSEKVKKILMQEALIEPLILFPNESENPRKER